MIERENLLASIASTIGDYRHGEIEEPTADHVGQWINQFDANVQVPMLRELDYVFKQTYVSKPKMYEFLADIADQIPCERWKSVHILDIQKKGRSQSEIKELFGKILKRKYGHNIDYGKSAYGNWMYFDDAVFTGNHIINDLTNKIHEIPHERKLIIIVAAMHTFAEYRIKNTFNTVPVKVRSRWLFENRLTWRNSQTGELAATDVLRPSEIGERHQSLRTSRFFSSVEGRELLEKQFLIAGEKIQGFSKSPDPNLRPLGYSNFELGFGSLFVTYRNCPNNCPLALWWGDPSCPSSHPFSHWYPLLPRKTNA